VVFYGMSFSGPDISIQKAAGIQTVKKPWTFRIRLSCYKTRVRTGKRVNLMTKALHKRGLNFGAVRFVFCRDQKEAQCHHLY
jgi:hypothetical protein